MSKRRSSSSEENITKRIQSSDTIFLTSCIRGDYNYIETNINNVEPFVINAGIRNAVLYKPRQYENIIRRLFNSKKITEAVVDEITVIAISNKDLELVKLIVRESGMYVASSSVEFCYKNLPDPVSFDIINFLIPNCKIDNKLKYYVRQACIDGYEVIVETILICFKYFTYEFFGPSNEFKESGIYLAYKHNRIGIVHKLINRDISLISDILPVIKTESELYLITKNEEANKNLNELIFMKTSFELFSVLYKKNSNRLLTYTVLLPEIYKYIHLEIRAKVNFILDHDRELLETPEYQKILTKTIENIIRRPTTSQSMLIFSSILSKTNNVDYFDLFINACTSNCILNIIKMYSYIQNNIIAYNMQEALINSCKYNSNIAIQFILERNRESTLNLNIIEALQTLCGEERWGIDYNRTIKCIETIFEFTPPPSVELLNNLVIFARRKPDIIEYLYAKGAMNMHYLYEEEIIANYPYIEINIFQIIMSKTRDNQIHLYDIHALGIEKYIYNKKKLKYLMTNGIRFDREDMTKIDELIDKNERQMIAAQLAIRKQDISLPVEIQQKITDFIKLT